MRRGNEDILKRLVERAVSALAHSPEAQALLRANGVTDAAVLKVYRIGALNKNVVAALDASDKKCLIELGMHRAPRTSPLTSGISFPTFDPREPNQPIGLVKLSPAQNKHGFVGAARGVACSADIAAHAKIIVTDTPLLMLRLAQAGVRGVVLAEVPAVLPPLAEWLKDREIILASHKKPGLAAMAAALKPLNISAQSLIIHAQPERITPEIWRALGVTPPKKEAAPKVAPPITPQRLKGLVEYAQSRLAAGAGADLLKELGIVAPEFVEVFGLGFIPSDYEQALSAEDRSAFAGRLAGNSILIPAFDEQGIAVDAMCCKRPGACPQHVHLLDAPQGLIVPRVASSWRDIVATDSFRYAAALWQSGRRNVLILRGEQDARQNVTRLRSAGVRMVTVAARRKSDADPVINALSRVGCGTDFLPLPKRLEEVGSRLHAGIPVEKLASIAPTNAEPVPVAAPLNGAASAPGFPPAATEALPATEAQAAEVQHFDYPAKPDMVSHDPRAMRAKFKAGDAAYEVETAFDCGPKLEIRVERDGKVHLDRFDVSKSAQRTRYAQSAALKTGTPFEVVEAHLIHLLDAVRDLQDEMLDPTKKKTASPASLIVDALRDEALALLKRPDLLDAVEKMLGALGWVGEERLKKLLFLVAVSRKLPHPLHAVLRALQGTGKSHGLETLCAITPPEDIVRVSALTEAALYHQGAGLKHKLLMLSESDVLEQEVIVQLRVLLSDGYLRKAGTQRDTATGQIVAEFKEAQGPVSFLSSTAHELDKEILDRCFDLALDESPEQTLRIQAAQRIAASAPGNAAARGQIAALLCNAQRLIDPMPVKIPFAQRIEFPATSVRHRREHQRLLRLIEASALLHQHQRLRDGEFLLADERDYRIAVEQMAGSSAQNLDELSRHAREVLALIQTANLTSFDVNELKALRPGWTRHKFRSGLDELLRLEILVSPRRARTRRYELVALAATTQDTPQVCLRPLSTGNHLAGHGESGFTNSTSERATG